MLIPAKVLRGLSNAACETGDTKHPRVLQGVCLQRLSETGLEHPGGKVTAMALDGRLLALATWREDDPHEVPADAAGGIDCLPRKGFCTVIHGDDCKKMAKMPMRHPDRPILGKVALEENAENGSLRAAGTDLDSSQEMRVLELEGKYPWEAAARAIHPSGTPEVTLLLDPFKLEQLLKVLRETTGLRRARGEQPMVKVSIYGPNEMLLFEVSHEDIQLRLGLMPLVEDAAS